MNIIGTLKNWFYERNHDGSIWYTIGHDDSTWSLGNKVQTLLNNPVTFSCTNLLADLFCQFKPLVDGEEDPNNPIVKLLSNPNPLQSKQDFLKEYIFFKQGEGWVFQYPVKAVGFKDYSYIYNLNPSKISYDKGFPTRLMFGRDAKELKKKQFRYEEEHLKRDFNINDVIPFFDIANGLSEDFLLKSPSRLKAVERNIRNINAALDAKHKAINKAGRFIVSGAQKGQAISRPFDPDEKSDIEKRFGGYGLASKNGDIIATNTMVDVHDLSVALKNLGLDESLMNDALWILNVFGMPLEMFAVSVSGATYENQKTAQVNYIQNTVQKHIDDYCNSLNSFFGLEGKNEISGTMNHLNVMQYIEEMKADKALKVSTAIRNLTGTNIDPEEFLENMGINLNADG